MKKFVDNYPYDNCPPHMKSSPRDTFPNNKQTDKITLKEFLAHKRKEKANEGYVKINSSSEPYTRDAHSVPVRRAFPLACFDVETRL